MSQKKIIDGDENDWKEDEYEEESWDIDDLSMPDWLRQYIRCMVLFFQLHFKNKLITKIKNVVKYNIGSSKVHKH